ncbi:hypothetical protein QR680_014234 [Steinernema hermaphroditum]|uniref:Uncharacterized protein n=1 Tax=Steinernema hermaphroditum TaxID=289476 RepID=A0AA39M3V9_9BILA|nr:hypothetical protein QR680_014234 [Steinernema hermaphroditum]
MSQATHRAWIPGLREGSVLRTTTDTNTGSLITAPMENAVSGDARVEAVLRVLLDQMNPLPWRLEQVESPILIRQSHQNKKFDLVLQQLKEAA